MSEVAHLWLIDRKPTLTVFANFFIDNEERFLRLKDSFLSFKDIVPDQWVMCVRGRYKQEVADYLKSNIVAGLDIRFAEDQSNWFKTSRKMARLITSDLVFFWIEDHICVAGHREFAKVLAEFHYRRVDVMVYSWHAQMKRGLQAEVSCDSGDHVDICTFNESRIRDVVGVRGDFYPFSAVSVMRTSFFKTILGSHKPYIKRWPAYTPFDFEKTASDRVISSFIYAFPKLEIFAAIDDDHGVDGYSLIARGLYPNRLSRNQMLVADGRSSDRKKFRLFSNLRFIKPIIAPVYALARRVGYTANYYFSD